MKKRVKRALPAGWQPGKQHGSQKTLPGPPPKPRPRPPEPRAGRPR